MKEFENNPSNIVSLYPAKEIRDKLLRKTYLSNEERIKELEEDMLRVIELTMQLEQALAYQEKFTRKLLHLLKDQEEVSSFSAYPTR